jgi:hypothetical protein
MRVRRFGILLCLGLAACQMSLPFKKDTPDAASAGVTAPAGAIMGGPITATPITPGGSGGGAAPVDTPAPSATPSSAQPSTVTTTEDGATTTVETLPAAAAPPPPEPKSEAQLACERREGTWTSAGKGFKSCVFRTRDGGKTCRKETDCDGLCLARSGTCAPYKPLFGCNDILDSMGRKVTLCID